MGFKNVIFPFICEIRSLSLCMAILLLDLVGWYEYFTSFKSTTHCYPLFFVQVDILPEHIELIDERFTRDSAPEGFTGVGGVYNFTFKPRSIGEGAIRLKYELNTPFRLLSESFITFI